MAFTGPVEPVVPAVAVFGDFGPGLASGLDWSVLAAAFELGEEPAVAVLAEEVAGVEVGFGPGFFGGLGELPVVEAGAEFGGDGLVFCRTVVMAQVVVGLAPFVAGSRRCPDRSRPAGSAV